MKRPGPDRLRGILDDGKRNTRALRLLAKQAHRDDRSRLPRASRLGRVRVEIEAVAFDVGKHRSGTHARDGLGRGDESVGRRDDLVTGADSQRHQRRHQCIGPRRHRNDMAHAEVRCKLVLEGFDVGSEDVAV